MNALAALALIASPVPQTIVGPIKPVNGDLTPAIQAVNLLANPGFEQVSGGKPVGWSIGGEFSFYAHQENPPFQGWTSMSPRATVTWGRSGARSVDLGVQPFTWSKNETDYSLTTFVGQTLGSPVSGGSIMSASAWICGECEATATVYYSLGRPTSVTKTVYSDVYASEWTRFTFGEAIAAGRKVTGIRITASLPLTHGYWSVGYDGEPVAIDDVSLIVWK